MTVHGHQSVATSATTSEKKGDALETNDQCTECGGKLRQEDTDIVCVDCGLITDERKLSTSIKNQSVEGTSSQIESPTCSTRHDDGLTTTIDSYNRDANGNKLSAGQRRRASRLRKWQTRTSIQGNAEQIQSKANQDIKRIVSALDMPGSVETSAIKIFEQVHDKGVLTGRTLEPFTATAVYAAAKSYDIPLKIASVKGVSRLTGEKTDKIDTALRHLLRELRIGPTTPEAFLRKFQSELDLGGGCDYEQRASNLLSKLKQKNRVSGRSPTGLAAAALYAAIVEQQPEVVTQAECAAVADVAEETIRKRFAEIREEAKADDDWTG